MSLIASGIEAARGELVTSEHDWPRAACSLTFTLAVAVAVRRQQEVSSDLDAGLIPITVSELLRPLRDTIIPPPRARPGAPAVLVGLATPPPARRPPSPPALERLCRRNTVITCPMTYLSSRLRGLTWAGLFSSGTRQVFAGTGTMPRGIDLRAACL